ncbi:hypothetical protein [Meridianimarinicoccus sp. MJW13]|uniref:hypothetical protein n=1 Tax=Meridianimarinicoccus sp. MJW13 TaxID=2720031 RepID=UPI0018663A83|nr:hypothetical protein [Fluviibacterium sp. MJW13]
MFFPQKSLFDAMQTWQRANLATAEMMMAANLVILNRTTQMMLGMMSSQEAARMIFEKPAAFAKSMEMAARAQAAGRDHAAMALAAVRPIRTKTRANARRLSRPRR